MEELNELREKIKNRYIIGTLIIIIIAILLFIFTKIIVFSFVEFMFGIVIVILSTYKLNKKYKSEFKNKFVLKSLEKKFTDLIYEPDRGITYSTIAATKMMRMGDRYHSEDYISAKYKDIKFEQSDVHIEEEYQTTDSDGHTTTHYVTIFRGRWMIFDFNKEFKANVQISQKGFSNSKVNTFWGKKEELFKKVAMESEAFNKKFNVYAQNEHDAFYIITPSLMERIERLAERNKGKLLFCFINNKLHIGIYDNKDSFEPGSVFKQIDEQETLNKISEEIETIIQFVEELNLDNDLFKKEV